MFLFWLASGVSYRMISRVFRSLVPLSTASSTVTEEVVAIRHKDLHLPKTPEDLEVESRGFAGLAQHRVFP